jgi:hypothetical protein
MAQTMRYKVIFAPASLAERTLLRIIGPICSCEMAPWKREHTHLSARQTIIKPFKAYAAFARFPDWVLAPVAFGSEVMGMVFYRHTWRVLEEVFASEPEALEHLHELLSEIMVDELGYIGERRSFLGNSGIGVARKTLPIMMRKFFAAIPEAEAVLDVNQMIHEALAFDYSGIDGAVAQRARIPAYCQV